MDDNKKFALHFKMIINKKLNNNKFFSLNIFLTKYKLKYYNTLVFGDNAYNKKLIEIIQIYLYDLFLLIVEQILLNYQEIV
jgi:hypothetical protein